MRVVAHQSSQCLPCLRCAEPSQKYEPHFDYFHDAENVRNGGQRIATMLMYLSDVQEGGETVFPSSPQKPVTLVLPYVRSRNYTLVPRFWRLGHSAVAKLERQQQACGAHLGLSAMCKRRLATCC